MLLSFGPRGEVSSLIARHQVLLIARHERSKNERRVGFAFLGYEDWEGEATAKRSEKGERGGGGRACRKYKRRRTSTKLGRERLGRDRSCRMEGLEVGEGGDGVPVVLNEAEVGEGVGEVGERRELEDDRLLLIGLERHRGQRGGRTREGRRNTRCLRRVLGSGGRRGRWWKRRGRYRGEIWGSRRRGRSSLGCTRRPKGSCKASRRLELCEVGIVRKSDRKVSESRTNGEPGAAGARMKVRSKDRTPIVGSEER